MNAPIVIEAEAPNIIELKNLIFTFLDKIDRNKSNLKKAKEMLDSALGNDEKYREAKEAEGKKKKKRLVIEAQIIQANPTPANKIEELREDLKEDKQAVSDYMSEYVRLTGKMELERPDGRMVTIVKNYKWMSPGQQKLL